MKVQDVLIAAVLICNLHWCATVHAKGALSDAAQRHFDAGIAYVDDPTGSKWEEALTEFRAAYAESPTWKLMNNIGLCALNLERDGEAIEAYKEYLSHGGEKGLAAKQRAQIEKDIAMLSAGLVTVTVSVEPPDATVVDERRNSKGELLVNRYPVKYGKAVLGLHPGHHKITMEASGFVSGTWGFDAEPASKHEHQFKLAPEKEPEINAPTPVPTAPAVTAQKGRLQPAEPKTRTGVYIGVAATGVFAAAATVTGILALNKQKAFDKANDPAEEDRLKKSGTNLGIVTDISIGAAVVSAGVTAYLYFAGASESHKSATVETHRNLQLSGFSAMPVLDKGLAGVAALGEF
jgi:hypothetical protein